MRGVDAKRRLGPFVMRKTNFVADAHAECFGEPLPDGDAAGRV